MDKNINLYKNTESSHTLLKSFNPFFKRKYLRKAPVDSRTKEEVSSMLSNNHLNHE